MSVSLYKSFLPEYKGCEAKAMAKLNGEWQEPDKDAFLLGSYVHSWNENKMNEFLTKHPEMFKKDGTLYAKYAIGDDMINALKNDPLVQKVREGSKEIIITNELFGIPWKAQIDIYNPEDETLIDLKTTRSLFRRDYNTYTKEYETFIKLYGYDVQMAVYAELERLYRQGDKHFMPHILAVTKENPPDKALINMGTDFIKYVLESIEIKLPHIIDVWQGKVKPERCGRCDYCRATKELKTVKYYYFEQDRIGDRGDG